HYRLRTPFLCAVHREPGVQRRIQGRTSRIRGRSESCSPLCSRIPDKGGRRPVLLFRESRSCPYSSCTGNLLSNPRKNAFTEYTVYHFYSIISQDCVSSVKYRNME